jgi:hypothetical protein
MLRTAFRNEIPSAMASIRRLAPLLLSLCWLAGPTWRVGAAEFGLLALTCKGDVVLPPDAVGGEDQGQIVFDATVIFADGEHLTLVDPETKKLDRPLSPAEVTRGSLEIVGREPEPMVWTSATGRRATLIGFALRADSSIVSLTIRSPGPDVRARRPFVLFDSRSGAVHRGECR